MQSEVVMPKATLLGGTDTKRAPEVTMPRLESATSAIIWLSYLGLVSLGIVIMGW